MASDLPDGVDQVGVPTEGEGHQVFILLLALAVALLALASTVGWVVFHHLTTRS